MKIVNIINFIRGAEPRLPIDLYLPVTRQIETVKQYDLPATWLLQYDALIDEKFTVPLKALSSNHEIGCWFEICKPLAVKAGIQWNCQQSWSQACNVGMTVGYSQADRIKLIDAYMARFKIEFGYHPKSAGAWYIDAFSLQYMHDKYGIIASCNCKDQIGTDGYTFQGGYWNGGYYPSKSNAFMPAQNINQQIPIPIFRMLGSCPIHQYDSAMIGSSQAVRTLEPADFHGGRNPKFVDWYFKMHGDSSCLGYSYVQVGQENSFGWNNMQAGFVNQCKTLYSLKSSLDIKTLADTGTWFKNEYQTTPSNAVVAIGDHNGTAINSIWYQSRFYRMNMFFKDGMVSIRDIHIFNESVIEQFYDSKCDSASIVCEALPVLDGFRWNGLFKLWESDGKWEIAANDGTLVITDGYKQIICRDDGYILSGADDCSLTWDTGEAPFVKTDGKVMECKINGFDYSFALNEGAMTIDGKDIKFKSSGFLDFRFGGNSKNSWLSLVLYRMKFKMMKIVRMFKKLSKLRIRIEFVK